MQAHDTPARTDTPQAARVRRFAVEEAPTRAREGASMAMLYIADRTPTDVGGIGLT